MSAYPQCREELCEKTIVFGIGEIVPKTDVLWTPGGGVTELGEGVHLGGDENVAPGGAKLVRAESVLELLGQQADIPLLNHLGESMRTHQSSQGAFQILAYRTPSPTTNSRPQRSASPNTSESNTTVQSSAFVHRKN